MGRGHIGSHRGGGGPAWWPHMRHINCVLTPATIDNAKPKDKRHDLTDGGGLVLEVMPSGSKTWRFKYHLDGKRENVTIGAYPAFTIKRSAQRCAGDHQGACRYSGDRRAHSGHRAAVLQPRDPQSPGEDVSSPTAARRCRARAGRTPPRPDGEAKGALWRKLDGQGARITTIAATKLLLLWHRRDLQKKAIVRTSMLSRFGAFGGVVGSSKALWPMKRARPSVSES